MMSWKCHEIVLHYITLRYMCKIWPKCNKPALEWCILVLESCRCCKHYFLSEGIVIGPEEIKVPVYGDYLKKRQKHWTVNQPLQEEKKK